VKGEEEEEREGEKRVGVFRVKHGEKITIGKRERENESRTVTSVGPFFLRICDARCAAREWVGR